MYRSQAERSYLSPKRWFATACYRVWFAAFCEIEPQEVIGRSSSSSWPR